MTGISTPNTYVIYRYDVPYTGKFTTEFGTYDQQPEQHHDSWARPGDHDPIEHQH